MTRSRRRQTPPPQLNIAGMVSADKTLGADPQWLLDANDPDKYYLVPVPVAIGGVIIEGLYLDANCHRSMPDRDVTFILTYKPAYGYSGPLVRLDWNPLHIHGNRGLVRGTWRFQPITETHLHPFTENYALGLRRMLQENLPIAFPLPEPLHHFRVMLTYLGSVLRILDIQKVRVPAWEPRLL